MNRPRLRWLCRSAALTRVLLALVLAAPGTALLHGCDRLTQAHQQSASAITESLPGYWVRANALRISDGRFAGEHMLLRFDADGSFHVIAKGVYPDQFHDTFKARDPFTAPQSGRSLMEFQWHGRWRINDNGENRLAFNFDFDRRAASRGGLKIASFDEDVMILKLDDMHDVVFHRYDIEELRDNEYYMDRVRRADELEGSNPLATQQRLEAQAAPEDAN